MTVTTSCSERHYFVLHYNNVLLVMVTTYRSGSLQTFLAKCIGSQGLIQKKKIGGRGGSCKLALAASYNNIKVAYI